MKDYFEVECYELIKLDKNISFVGVEKFEFGFDSGVPSIFSKNEGEEYPKHLASFKSNNEALDCCRKLNDKLKEYKKSKKIVIKNILNIEGYELDINSLSHCVVYNYHILFHFKEHVIPLVLRFDNTDKCNNAALEILYKLRENTCTIYFKEII